MAGRFGFDHPIVIADVGLLSRNNIDFLDEAGYQYILGARPKSDSADVNDRDARIFIDYDRFDSDAA